MSQDFINDLPTELLNQVFGYLERKERETVRDVCQRWFDILSSETFLETLVLKPHHLKGNIDYAKRYRSISIDLLPCSYDVWRLRKFLHDKVVMENLEELYLDFNKENWYNLIGSQEELHFPKLRKITFRKLQYKILITTGIDFIHKCNLDDQIEKLAIEDSPPLVLPKADPFPNLRSLTLDYIQHFPYTHEDSFKMIARRLTELNIFMADSLNLKNILHNACDLESLSISGEMPMSGDTYEAINHVKKLKQLSLIIPIDKQARGLSLPFLKKLTVYDHGLMAVENVPNLRSLCIVCDTWGTYGIRRVNKIDHYRMFGHQLHHLTVIGLFLDKDHVSQICTLSSLQTLKIQESQLEFADVEKICKSIGNIKLLRLEYGIVACELILCHKLYGFTCECKKCMGILSHNNEAEQREKLTTGFSNLRALYVDCAITHSCHLTQYDFVDV